LPSAARLSHRRRATNHRHNRGGQAPLHALRPQIQDLPMENIADLAMRARELGGFIPLWHGEGDMVTPAYIRDAAKAAPDEGLTFPIPDMRGHRPLIEGNTTCRGARLT
jgi:hypothetical protein